MVIVTMNNGDIFHVEAEGYLLEGDIPPELYFYNGDYEQVLRPRYFVEHPDGTSEIKEEGEQELYLFIHSISSIEVPHE